MFCLVRTDHRGEEAGRHQLPADRHEEQGVTVRPIVLLDGSVEVNEVFLDDVEVPVEQRVGEENQGWTIAKYLLEHERTGIANVGINKRELARARRLARECLRNGRPLAEDPLFAARLAEVEIELMALDVMNLRVLAAARDRGSPGPMASMLKIKGSELYQRIAELILETQGRNGAGLRLGPAAAALGAGPGGGVLPEPAQGDDLRRLQRDPAQHHRQACARSLGSGTCSPRFAVAFKERRGPGRPPPAPLARTSCHGFLLPEDQSMFVTSCERLVREKCTFDARRAGRAVAGRAAAAAVGRVRAARADRAAGAEGAGGSGPAADRRRAGGAGARARLAARAVRRLRAGGGRDHAAGAARSAREAALASIADGSRVMVRARAGAGRATARCARRRRMRATPMRRCCSTASAAAAAAGGAQRRSWRQFDGTAAAEVDCPLAMR
jgi:hypothetical protein